MSASMLLALLPPPPGAPPPPPPLAHSPPELLRRLPLRILPKNSVNCQQPPGTPRPERPCSLRLREGDPSSPYTAWNFRAGTVGAGAGGGGGTTTAAKAKAKAGGWCSHGGHGNAVRAGGAGGICTAGETETETETGAGCGCGCGCGGGGPEPPSRGGGGFPNSTRPWPWPSPCPSPSPSPSPPSSSSSSVLTLIRASSSFFHSKTKNPGFENFARQGSVALLGSFPQSHGEEEASDPILRTAVFYSHHLIAGSKRALIKSLSRELALSGLTLVLWPGGHRR